jgi:hypothetical protein
MPSYCSAISKITVCEGKEEQASITAERVKVQRLLATILFHCAELPLDSVNAHEGHDSFLLPILTGWWCE